jgi:uncharacterized membrane protein YgdD (TMEM256/DUF423 family)
MKKYLILGCAFTGLAVIFGAFGAHLLKAKISETNLATFSTAVQYQFIHGLGILIASILFFLLKSKFIKLGIISFAIGISLFSGSLYLLSLREIIDFNINYIIGPLTPIGGIFFIGGWLLLIIGISKHHFNED